MFRYMSSQVDSCMYATMNSYMFSDIHIHIHSSVYIRHSVEESVKSILPVRQFDSSKPTESNK